MEKGLVLRTDVLDFDAENFERNSKLAFSLFKLR